MSKTKAGPAQPPRFPKPEGARAQISATSPEGRRRAGLSFGFTGTATDLDDLTQEQWEAILSDPQLTVRPVAPPEPTERIDPNDSDQRQAALLAAMPTLSEDDFTLTGPLRAEVKRRLAGQLGFAVTDEDVRIAEEAYARSRAGGETA